MKQNPAKNTFQQGDVVGRMLGSNQDIPASAKITKGRLVLAHGESGHSHVIEDDEAELIEIGERMLLRLGKQATVTHEEHNPITLSPGIWEVGRVQEFDYFAQMKRNVID